MKKLFILLFLLNISCIKILATSSEVTNKTTRLNREMYQVKSDIDIENTINKNIKKYKKSFLIENNIRKFGYYEIKCVEGRVLLTGNVNDYKVKNYIINKITENIKVREILDELNIGNIDKNDFSDFFLKRQMIMKLFFRSKIRSLNYELSVVNGNVYVIGIAEDKNELELITKLISTVKGVNTVISYVITQDSEKKIKLDYLLYNN